MEKVLLEEGASNKTEMTDNGDGKLKSNKEVSQEEHNSAYSGRSEEDFSLNSQVEQPANDQKDATKADVDTKSQGEGLLLAKPEGNQFKLVFDAKGARLALTNN
ncbi:uncharacterized protein LOC144648542 [Oculina patagonica]